MVRYVIVLLLTNTFYCVLGYPTDYVYGPLVKSLQLLGNNCKNTFLSTQIKNNLDACNVSLSAGEQISKTELQCFIFYDINSQLCTASPDLKFDLTRANVTLHDTLQKVENTCNLSKNWKFTELTQYPKYKSFEKTFKNPVSCLKVCGVDNLVSEDTNFYCKYFQWGSQLLHQVQEVTTLLSVNIPGAKLGEQSPFQNTASKPDITVSAPTSTNIAISPSLQVNSQDTNVNVPHAAGAAASNPTSVVSNLGKPDVVLSSTSGSVVLNTGSPINSAQLPTGNKDNTVKANGTQDLNHSNVDDGFANLNDKNENGIGDENSEDENGIDGLPSNQGIDGGPEPDPSFEDKPKGPLKDYYFNRMDDGYTVDDDHFFSFFLTAIILVVFLYVLYHNKSKFRKLFLGLLVEGRQAGRRRNSRGHEYRRIDTLEQMMSTTSSAPPSKIIY